MTESHEVFDFGIYRFDIDLAKKLIGYGLIDAPINTIDPILIANSLGIGIDRNKPLSNKHQKMFLFFGVNWDHAATLTPEQLAVPGIMAVIGSRKTLSSLLIDGNHRLARLIYDGVDSFSTYYISEKFSKMINVRDPAYFKALAQIKKHEKFIAKSCVFQGSRAN